MIVGYQQAQGRARRLPLLARGAHGSGHEGRGRGLGVVQEPAPRHAAHRLQAVVEVGHHRCHPHAVVGREMLGRLEGTLAADFEDEGQGVELPPGNEGGNHVRQLPAPLAHEAVFRFHLGELFGRRFQQTAGEEPVVVEAPRPAFSLARLPPHAVGLAQRHEPLDHPWPGTAALRQPRRIAQHRRQGVDRSRRRFVHGLGRGLGGFPGEELGEGLVVT